ncbi:MAG: carbohydrate ABC transporter permease [Clostridia bacterium]|nr:carbohydrate ABC transporter permease [Clostridia bacterium]
MRQNREQSSKIRIPLGERIFYMADNVLMILLCVVILIPLIHVVAGSFSDGTKYMSHVGILLWPLDFTLEAYEAVARNPNIWTGYSNTLFVVFVGTVLNLLFSLIAAYVLSRKNYMLKRLFNLMVVFSMYFSGGMIPFFLIVRSVGLYNSIWSLIIPPLINVFNLVIVRTAMLGVPDSLEESAQLDGAGHLTVLFRIITPLIKPTVAVIALYYAVSHWNSWFNASLFLKKRNMYPLQLILREIIIQNDLSASSTGDEAFFMSETIQFATIVVATLPILCVYPFIQKYFVKGIMVGAVKG